MALALAGLALVAGLWVAIVLLLYVSGRRAVARELARFLPNVALLFNGLVRDERVPRRSKLLLLFGLAWVASPIDLIPDFLPVIGHLDDAIVAALVLRYVVRAAGRDVVVAHWRGEPATIERLLALSGAGRRT